MATRRDRPDGAPRPDRTLGPAYIAIGAIVAVLLTILLLGASACSLGANKEPLAAQRCGSVLYTVLLPLLGFVIFAGGLWLAKRRAATWPASIGFALALAPGVLAWRLLSG